MRRLKEFVYSIARAMVELEVSSLAKTIEFLKNETISDEYHKEWLSKQK